MRKGTCILFFSRSVAEESKAKLFDHRLSARENVIVAKKLINHSLSVIRSTGITYIHYSEKMQSGLGFGERLSNAVHEVVLKGFEQVLVIGNDCPTLTRADLLDANAALQQGKTVIGPTTEGGVYMIGLQSAQFDAEAFKSLLWNTNQCFEAICNYVQNEELDVLKSAGDINCLTTYLQSISRCTQRRITLYFKLTFLSRVVNQTCFLIDFSTRLSAESDYLRGPPSILSVA